MPGIAPTIYAHRQAENSAALLFEYLGGQTFEQIILSGSKTELANALEYLVETLSKVWLKTKKPMVKPSNFVE